VTQYLDCLVLRAAPGLHLRIRHHDWNSLNRLPENLELVEPPGDLTQERTPKGKLVSDRGKSTIVRTIVTEVDIEPATELRQDLKEPLKADKKPWCYPKHRAKVGIAQSRYYGVTKHKPNTVLFAATVGMKIVIDGKKVPHTFHALSSTSEAECAYAFDYTLSLMGREPLNNITTLSEEVMARVRAGVTKFIAKFEARKGIQFPIKGQS